MFSQAKNVARYFCILGTLRFIISSRFAEMREAVTVLGHFYGFSSYTGGVSFLLI